VLFGYPIAATAENWLHECLCDMLGSIHRSLAAGTEPSPWPDIIPAPHRTQLSTRGGLRTRLATYTMAATAVSQQERDAVIAVSEAQNDIPSLLSCASDCATLDELPGSIRMPIKQLFGYAFELLSDLGIRDRQYAIIHAQTRYHVCPFCGCEYFAAPRGRREALDHYLVESKYPFAAANLRNLAPAGNTCNSRYKLTKDVLRRDDGTRRRSFDPYNARGLTISLDESEPNIELDGSLIAAWRIDFSEDSEQVNTWDSVFSVRERYERDVLKDSFSEWLWEFRNWCRSANLVGSDESQVINAIHRYVGYLEACGFNDRAFLKAAVFRMLGRHCLEGQRRILAVMRDLARSGIAEASS
jgi:hypothetical protein